MEKIKTIIHQKSDKKHKDSFWYDGDIATFKYKDKEVLLMACGDIRINNKAGELVWDCKERNSGIKGGLKEDKDLRKIGQNYTDNYYWENNNWFECLYKKKGEDTWQDVMGEVQYHYDDAIRMAKKLIKDNYYWRKI